MSALALTVLQLFTLLPSVLLAFLLLRKVSSWPRLLVTVLVGWPLSWFGGVIVWALSVFPQQHNQAIVAGMPKSAIFAVIAPFIGIYLARRVRLHQLRTRLDSKNTVS